MLNKEIQHSFSKYFDISEAQPFMSKKGMDVDLESFALSDEIKTSKPSNLN